MNLLLNPPPVVWPLLAFLLALLLIRKISDEGKPIFSGIVSGIAKNATNNAGAYAIATAFGLSASLSAFIDVFKEMSSDRIAALSYHQYFVLWAKVLNPFVVAILAYATQNNFKPSAGDTISTETTSSTSVTTTPKVSP